MAIKRPSKNRGTPIRKPVSATSARHVDVKPKHQMVAGEHYQGWACKNKNCGVVIAIALESTGGKGASVEVDDLTAIKCPHCGDEDLYRWNARADLAYQPKS
jgi:predicted RNA-binding Zn-ribbon protein involved in translation (DUF1610 family)